jgi:hypothetical protein
LAHIGGRGSEWSRARRDNGFGYGSGARLQHCGFGSVSQGSAWSGGRTTASISARPASTLCLSLSADPLQCADGRAAWRVVRAKANICVRECFARVLQGRAGRSTFQGEAQPVCSDPLSQCRCRLGSALRVSRALAERRTGLPACRRWEDPACPGGAEGESCDLCRLLGRAHARVTDHLSGPRARICGFRLLPPRLRHDTSDSLGNRHADKSLRFVPRDVLQIQPPPWPSGSHRSDRKASAEKRNRDEQPDSGFLLQRSGLGRYRRVRTLERKPHHRRLRERSRVHPDD